MRDVCVQLGEVRTRDKAIVNRFRRCAVRRDKIGVPAFARGRCDRDYRGIVRARRNDFQPVPAIRLDSETDHTAVGLSGQYRGKQATAEIGPFRNEDGTVRVAEGEELDLFVVEAGDTVVLASYCGVCRTVTSALRGIFRDDSKTRVEFLRLAHGGKLAE